jgi:hypothetical protein
MARRNENSRHSNYVLRIVCEGEKTEPLFFSDLCQAYLSDNPSVDARTIPQPPVVEEEVVINSQRGNYRGKKRKVNNPDDVSLENTNITGVPPLKWVRYARQILNKGVDEAWAVYDKDNHPMHKEAADEAARIIDGKRVNIAFSSRSFEYYLLLHFEYLYHRFEETECGQRLSGKKYIYECGTGRHPEHDCHGEKCINGYARTHGYWQESKSSTSTFPLVKDKLITGLVNACRLRMESDNVTQKPFYERNPYTTADKLVSRIIGCETVEYGETYHYSNHKDSFSIKLVDRSITISNGGNTTQLLTRSLLSIYDVNTQRSAAILEKNILLNPGESTNVQCNLNESQVVALKIDGKLVLFVGKP